MRRLYALFTLLPALAVFSPAPSHAQLISISIAPPILPVYVQPPIPSPGYIWTPGYWAYAPEGYYWVPGTWVMPPTVGLLWTPGYWGWNNGVYAWNGGYWGHTVGFYGGVNYGFGYGGLGFEGGMWRGGAFVYNRSVNNFGSVNITNVYNKTVIVNNSHVAFNGGAGGVAVQPTPQERMAMNQPHVAPTALQTQHQQTASQTKANFASVNHGAPAVAATAKPGVFSGAGVVAAHGAPGGAAPGGLAHGPGATTPNAAAAVHTPGSPAANGAPAAAAHTPGNPAVGGAPAATANHVNNPSANASLHPVVPSAAGGTPQAPHPTANVAPQAPQAPHPAAAAAPQAPHPVAAAPRAAPNAGRPAGGGRPAQGQQHRPG